MVEADKRSTHHYIRHEDHNHDEQGHNDQLSRHELFARDRVHEEYGYCVVLILINDQLADQDRTKNQKRNFYKNMQTFKYIGIGVEVACVIYSTEYNKNHEEKNRQIGDQHSPEQIDFIFAHFKPDQFKQRLHPPSVLQNSLPVNDVSCSDFPAPH
ncbi:hypothetical protein D3C75_914210 [compost metagenome]